MHTVHAQKLLRAPSNSPLVQIRENGSGYFPMAEEQMVIEQPLNSRLDNAVIAFKNLDARVTGLEKRLSLGSHITETQAFEVGQEVKALAEYLTTQDKSKTIIMVSIRSYTGPLG